MSVWKPTVILCDAPGCRAQWVVAEGHNAIQGRKHCAAKGWTCGYNKDYCPEHPLPEKRARSIWRLGAHAMVQEALKFGTLVRRTECEGCSSTVNVVAHHDDYKRPLDVRWLCGTCHQAWHSKHGHGANYFAEDDVDA